MTNSERRHIEMIKGMPCGVCSADGPSDAHHLLEGGRRVGHFAVIPLCRKCHNQVPNGSMWKIYKQTELKVIAETLERILYG